MSLRGKEAENTIGYLSMEKRRLPAISVIAHREYMKTVTRQRNGRKEMV
jgi:hypothetical protein